MKPRPSNTPSADSPRRVRLAVRCRLFFFSFIILATVPSLSAQVESGLFGRSRVIQGVDEANRVTLAGNTYPEARAGNDRGAVASNFAMEHMFLQLKRSPEQEQALQQYLDSLADQRVTELSPLDDVSGIRRTVWVGEK